MELFQNFFSPTAPVEIVALLATLVLCSLIGLERQVRQKAAGFRTNVLVGMGSCAFTLVSGFGFATILGTDVTLDPSRIAAQVDSGIGFLGAGVIFKGNDVIRGLTTAATVWVSAAVGMAAGAGMLALAVALTAFHLITLFVLAPLVRRIPNPDRYRFVEVAYVDGAGVLRDVLGAATSMGFSSSIDRTRRVDEDGRTLVIVSTRFHGRPPLSELVPRLMDIPGVRRVSVRSEDDSDESHSA